MKYDFFCLVKQNDTNNKMIQITNYIMLIYISNMNDFMNSLFGPMH